MQKLGVALVCTVQRVRGLVAPHGGVVVGLIAALSLVMVNLRVAQAQQSNTTEAGTKPAPERAANPKEDAANKEHDGTVKPSPAGEETPSGGTVTIDAKQKVETLTVRDKILILAGTVSKDVLAINSIVVVRPTGRIGHVLAIINGSVQNESGHKLNVVHLDPNVLQGLTQEAAPAPTLILPGAAASGGSESVVSENVVPRSRRIAEMRLREGRWQGGQFALWLFGMLTAGIASLLAPRALRRTSDVTGREPGRCLLVGGLGLLLLLAALIINGGMMHSPLHLLWGPFALALALGCAALVTFGWLCGMRTVGSRLLREAGREENVSPFKAVAVGLTAFFLLNSLLGAMQFSLFLIAFGVEILCALAGLGAAFVSGLQGDPDWLSSRLRRVLH